MTTIVINEETENKRIDIALSSISAFSRSMIQKLIYENKIKKNGEFVKKPNEITKIEDIFEIEEPSTNIDYIAPEEPTNNELKILFEDEYIIVLNKPAHLIVHPGAGNPKGTLINYLAYHCQLSDINGAERLGVVHRLDKGVSGCIILAKSNEAHVNLSAQFQNREVQKEYIAICYGNYFANTGSKEASENTAGIMEDHMGRSTTNRKKMETKSQEKYIGRKFNNHLYDVDIESTKGKHAVMAYHIQKCIYLNETDGFITQIQCFPKTGRMHQIRVQLSSRRLPIIGDTTYGTKQNARFTEILGERIALHAKSIQFLHPITKETLKFESELPKEFATIIELTSA